MIHHTDLPDGGIIPHHEIDARLPTEDEKDALGGEGALPGDLILSPGQAIVFLTGSNTSPTANGNWRIVADGNNLNIEIRSGDAWVTEAYFEP
jgi:hypothetical protein